MKAKERVLRAVTFKNPDRVPLCKLHFPSPGFIETLKVMFLYPGDIFLLGFVKPKKKVGKFLYKDSWGAVWHTESLSDKGQVVQAPLENWENLDKIKVPVYDSKLNTYLIKLARVLFRNKFLLGELNDNIFSTSHFLRGYVEFMEDLYLERENLEKLADILTELSIDRINQFADLGIDGVMGSDDLGLQDRLMISPDMFREIYKPRYKKIIEAAHNRGMKFFLHSCGYIMDIIEDFIEIGLDALQCDQQDNMGVDTLNERFGGRMTFFSPVDIQTTLSTNDCDKIYKKSRYLVDTLGSHNGGFIGKIYPQPRAIGALEKSIRVMLDAFLDKK